MPATVFISTDPAVFATSKVTKALMLPPYGSSGGGTSVPTTGQIWPRGSNA